MSSVSETSAVTPKPAVVELRGIRKAFGGTPVLHEVDLTLRAGEVHGLVGENGAGKSTLVKILTGLHGADGGEIRVAGEPVSIASPTDAERAGIQVIHQDRHFASRLSVAEQLFLGRPEARLLTRSRRRFEQAARERLSETVGLDLDPAVLMERLSVADQQLVQIARALLDRPRVLVLDEPTAPLAAGEVHRLYETVARLREQGTALLYISHYLQEIREITDRVTVLRDGRVIGELDMHDPETRLDDIVTLMVGREIDEFGAADRSAGGRREPLDGGPALEIVELRTGVLRDLTLAVRPGEIVGITGLVGSGIEVVGDAVVGSRPRSGQVGLHGRRVRTPRAFVRAGGGYVPAERRERGIQMRHTVRENLTVAALDRLSLARIFLRRSREEGTARELVDQLDIRPPRTGAVVGTLSGGNQQKVSLGKWLARPTRVFVLDQPTAGVDIGSRTEIYLQIRELVAAGAAVLLVSVDLEEVVGLSDRVLVLYRGSLVAELDADGLTTDRLLAASAGADVPQELSERVAS
ncbi:MAG: sugar ABC transporter ATP-binding protein [Nocardioidaceae bacterium]